MKMLFKAGVSLGVLAAVAAAGGKVEAAGFAIKEQSGSSLGQAFSNASTGSGDISHMFFNPATLAQHNSFQFVVLGSYIAPFSEVSNGSSTFNPAGVSSQGDIGENAFVPAFYAAAPIMDGLVAGIGVNAPFGLVTQYDPNWVGNFHAIKSDLSTININPAVGWQVTDQFSIGGGLQIEYIEAELTNRAALTPMGPLGPTTTATLKGDDWAVGFNLGALFEPTEDLTFGVGYRSQVKHTLTGTTTLAGVRTFKASADATMPDMLTAGVTYDINERWSVSAEFQYTFWSDFEQLVVENQGGPNSITDEQWDDQVFVAFGGAYKIDDKWTLRAGVAYDETPIPDETRTPRVPGNSRYWLAIGASYEVNEWFGVDAGYTHIFVDDSEVRLNGTGNDASRGALSADYENGIDILSVQARFSF